jgi:transposase
LGGRPRARILVEASTESEWVARCLEALGHEVVVADPNFAPMYATRTRKVKTDRRDARALQEACLLGAYRPAHRLSDAQRHVRGRLAVRDALVRTRTSYIALTRALLRRHGWRVPTGSAETFSRRVLALSLPGRLLSEVAPLLAAMRTVNVSPPTCAAARRCPRLPPRWPRRDREVREGPVDVDYANCTNGP